MNAIRAVLDTNIRVSALLSPAGNPAAIYRMFLAGALEADRVFYDTAKSAAACLITGNSKHYPREPFILSPAEFLALGGRTKSNDNLV